MKNYLPLFLTVLMSVFACRNDKAAPAPKTTTAAEQAEGVPNISPDTSLPPAPPKPSKAAEEPKTADKIEPLQPVQESPMKGKAASGAGIPVSPAPVPHSTTNKSSVSKSGFSDVATLDPSIKLDIRYATADNFTKSKIYDCPRCLLRPEAAKALARAHKALQKRGLGLKMFDCYRPRPYQQRLWDKVPNPDYVTPPAKGSMHSRGAAVDLTLVDKSGKELDMGTPYDFFGREAHTDNTNLPAQVLVNRRLLREALEAVGFKGIRTEWWHFSFQGKNYPLSDYVWPCPKQE
jgi:D-alanyl-D-alanine dipeptidase